MVQEQKSCVTPKLKYFLGSEEQNSLFFCHENVCSRGQIVFEMEQLLQPPLTLLLPPIAPAAQIYDLSPVLGLDVTLVFLLPRY